MTEQNNFVLPGWVRLLAMGFALLFGLLAFWLTGRIEYAGFPAGVGAAIAAALSIILVAGAVRGRLWKWMWFVPGL